MGKKSKKTKGVSKNQQATSDSLSASLERCLSLATTGTASKDNDNHSLTGDCPLCLDRLPPFWEQERRHTYLCCGKSTCLACREQVRENILDAAKERILRVVEEATQAGEPAFLSNNWNDHIDEENSRQWQVCPFCRTRIHDNKGIFTREVKELCAQNAENGYPWAQYILSMDHLGYTNNRPGNSIIAGGGRNTKLGTKLLHDSAEQGYPLAVFALAQGYGSGAFGLPKSVETSNRLMQLASKQGHGEAGVKLYAVSLEKGTQNEKALEYLKQSADLGHGMACFILAGHYEEGELGLEKNLDHAFHYYKFGAELGLDVAQFQAARLCQELLGDKEAEIKYLKMAAEQRHTSAQCHLGKCYIDHGGEWIKGKNWVSGVRWLRRARAAGSGSAASCLENVERDTKGVCFHCGKTSDGEKSFNRCSKCRCVYYCSRDCQKQAWKAGHNDVCVKYDE